jgi:hypothetical protein
MIKYSDVLLSKDDSIPRIPTKPTKEALYATDYRHPDLHDFGIADHKPTSNASESYNRQQNVWSAKPSLKDSIKELGWDQFPLLHYWNIGYQAPPALKIMMKLPPRLNFALMRFCNALHFLAQDSTKTLENKYLLRGLDCDMADNPDLSHCRRSDEVMLWEEELHYGLIRIEFDPVNQSRKSFDVNTRAAQLWNSSKAELLERFRACDVPSQLTDLDWVRAFAVYLATYFDDTVTQFLRFTTACGGTFNATLVCATTTKTFDSVGRISQAPIPLPPLKIAHKIRLDFYPVRTCQTKTESSRPLHMRYAPQIRCSLRVVSPRQYDEAARRTPHACPHVLSGDRRTGQQLLDEATADALRTVGRAAQSRAGTAALNQIAAYLEARLGDVERAFKLCAGGGSGGLLRPPWDQWCGPCLATRPTVVLHPNRPIAHGWGGGIRLDGDGPVVSYMASRQLAQPAARWAWNLGFESARMMSIIVGVPPPLVDAMRRLLAAKQRVAKAATQRLAVASAAVWSVGPVGAGAGHGPPHQLRLPLIEDEESMWEQADVALMQLDLDPATQRRARLTCSAGAARLWGQHREEWMARFAAHEGILPFTDLGALCALLADAGCGRDGGVVLYHRFSFGHGPTSRAELVCGCKSREFDSLGRVRQVSVGERSSPLPFPLPPSLHPSAAFPSGLIHISTPSHLLHWQLATEKKSRLGLRNSVLQRVGP